MRAVAWVAGLSASCLTLVACQRLVENPLKPPAAEFLFAAGDSTYWVRSNAEGLRVRSAPILLTQVDGHFIEVFIADDGVEYADASFASSRVFARDITGKDSIRLFDDGTVLREAAAWKHRHPLEEPIDLENEEVPTDPRTVASEEIEVLDVHGPWVTFNHLLNIDVADHQPHRHAGHRYVVDVRTGAQATLATLFGDTEAHRLINAGQASFRQLTDSIKRATGDRADMARETLDSFHFDSTSFGLTDMAREPAVAFMIPGTGIDGEALALNLPPIAAHAPSWWSSVQSTLPAWSTDSSLVRWTRKGYDVIARPNADANRLALYLAPGPQPRAKEWPIATVPIPAYQLIPLDAPQLSTAIHNALARAFDASSSLSGVQTAVRSSAAAARTRVRLIARVAVPSLLTHASHE